VSEVARPLLLPDEVRRLAPERELLFVKGERPVLAERLDYRRDREFAGRFRENPLHQAVR
jgi:type IV secretion system protein VirD4